MHRDESFPYIISKIRIIALVKCCWMNEELEIVQIVPINSIPRKNCFQALVLNAYPNYIVNDVSKLNCH
jgi:hypothetical protein